METDAQIVQKCWARLIAVHGRPRLLDELRLDEQRNAVAEARVLLVVVTSDGFGSGYVRMTAPEPAATELPPLALPDGHRTQAFVVFATPLVLTELEREMLGSEMTTPWERWSEVPSLPDPPQRRGGAELINALGQLCPSYVVAVRAPRVPPCNDLSFHLRVLAGAAAEEIEQGRAEGLRPVFEAVARLYPQRPSLDGRHEGPWVLMNQLLEDLLARGVDHAQVEALLPQGLRRCWGTALEDRFCPPHDGFY